MASEADFSVSFYEPAQERRESQPNRTVNRTKSQASFIIPPKKTSETVIASSGETIQLEYAHLKRHPVITGEGDSPIVLSRPNPLETPFITYLRSILTTPILKASFTYFIASLFVYVPAIASLLGSTDSKHIICTVVVYFHSSRTVGSMIQSLMFVGISLIFGITVSVSTLKLVSSMLNGEVVEQSSAHPITLTTDIETFSIIITLLICSMSLGTISFFKHRISKPTFNTSCSLCAILIISCLIKEYSKIFNSTDPNSLIAVPWDKIISSIDCILTGCLISVSICFSIWRKSAKNNLINSLNDIEKLCGSTVGFLCDSFISSGDGAENDPEIELKLIQDSKHETLKIFNDLQSKLNKLDASLEETQFETYTSGKEREYALLKDLVHYEKKMAVNLGSLSRAVEFKWDILQEYQTQRLQNGDNHINVHNQYDLTTHDFMNVIESDSESSCCHSDDSTMEVETDAVIEPQELFDLFFFHIGPSTRSFVFTMKEILNDPMFNKDLKVKQIVNQYDRSLETAKSLYQNHQLKAINSLYKQDIFTKDYNFDGKVSHEEIAATCANFSYSLTQFSIELQTLLKTMNLLNEVQEQNTKSFEFLKFWKKPSSATIPELLDLERGRVLNIFNSNTNDSETNSLSYKFWELTKFFRGIDFQFGLRVALGALILGSFAFMPLTGHIFTEWRGEWVLVTFCIIMNKSLGGTVMTVKWRFLGTFVGAFMAYWVWILFYPNVVLMALSGFIVSIPCFGIILNWKTNNAFGRFILLTYNLTVLYSYTMSLNSGSVIGGGDDWEGGDNPIIFEIAFHRYIGVSVGVIWAVIITLTLFPMSARARVKEGLTTLWLRMGLIWKSGPLSSIDQYESINIGSRLIGLNGLSGCHSIHSELVTLHKQAPMEIRLKGEYPVEKYQTLINCTGNIIDSFENMNSIIEVDPMLSSIEIGIINDLKAEIKELENRVFLMFYMLSSAMTLKLPLMARAAGTEHSMEKVIAKLSDVRRQTILIQGSNSVDKNQILSNEEFVLFFTYCLVTEAVVKQLNIMMIEVVGLFDKFDEDLVELL